MFKLSVALFIIGFISLLGLSQVFFLNTINSSGNSSGANFLSILGGIMSDEHRVMLGSVVNSTINTILDEKDILLNKPIGRYGDAGKSYGIAGGSNLVHLSQADLDKRFDQMKTLGVQWVRIDIDWSDIQRDGPNSYYWDSYDRVINDANLHGMNVLSIITYTPAWVRADVCADSPKCSPKNADDFAAFAAKAVARYKVKGLHYWEIWNEENIHDFWAPVSNCQYYTVMLQKSYIAIKKADPYAFVLTGGLSPATTDGTNMNPVDYLKCVYNSGGQGYFDAVAMHPYTFPQLPSYGKNEAWAQMYTADATTSIPLTGKTITIPSMATTLRNTMVARGDVNKKIWITEVGAPTGGPGGAATNGRIDNPGLWHVDENLQADILADDISLYRTYDWVGPFFWYSFKDSGTSTSTSENFFGLLRNDESKKAAYQVYADIIAGKR